MSTPSLRVALVGCGTIGRTHAATVLNHRGYELTTLVAPRREAGEGIADDVASATGRRPMVHSSLEKRSRTKHSTSP